MENTQTQPTLMERFLEQMLANQTRQLEQSEKYSGLAEKTAAQQSEWMEMLMAEHRKKQSANPFIALLDGYIGMKKRKNPEYEWRGLATTVPEAIGGLLGRTRRTKVSSPMNFQFESDPLREPGIWLLGGK
jgi:SpoVK/Ycf46/Vps4 family AAA+-type ATPase